MQITAEQKSLMLKIGIGLAAVAVVMVITMVILNVVNPRKDTGMAAVDTPAKTVIAPAPTIGTTESIDAITEQDASGESTINAAYEKNDQTVSQEMNKAAESAEGSYNESNL